MIQASQYEDEAWYEENFADEYLITGQDLQVVNKEQIIEYASSAEEISATVEIDDWQTIVDGDTVVSLYKISWKFDDGGTNEARITDVWSHRTGQWVLLAQHASQYIRSDALFRHSSRQLTPAKFSHSLGRSETVAVF